MIPGFDLCNHNRSSWSCQDALTWPEPFGIYNLKYTYQFHSWCSHVYMTQWDKPRLPTKRLHVSVEFRFDPYLSKSLCSLVNLTGRKCPTSSTRISDGVWICRNRSCSVYGEKHGMDFICWDLRLNVVLPKTFITTFDHLWIELLTHLQVIQSPNWFAP